MTRKVAATAISLSFIFSIPLSTNAQPINDVVSGKPKFTLMGENDVAPYSGLLFNPEAASVLLTEGDNEQNKCLIELERLQGKLENECDLKVNQLKLSLEIKTKSYEMQLSEKDKQIERLEKIATSSDNGKFLWLGLGAAAGIALTVLTIFAVNSASS